MASPIIILYVFYTSTVEMSFVRYFGICNIILSSPYDSFILHKFNVKIIETFIMLMLSNLQNYSGANYSENSFNFIIITKVK